MTPRKAKRVAFYLRAGAGGQTVKGLLSEK